MLDNGTTIHQIQNDMDSIINIVFLFKIRSVQNVSLQVYCILYFKSIFEWVFQIFQDRLGQSGTDGQRVQEFVRNIHPTQPIQRNDFSNIGLPPPGNDNWDNISITSVSAHAVPYTQVIIIFHSQVSVCH